jgi:hypothetical protein
MATAVHWYNTVHVAQWRRSRALLKMLDTAIGQVLWPIVAIGHSYAGFFEFFHRQFVEKGRGLMLRPQITIGV